MRNFQRVCAPKNPAVIFRLSITLSREEDILYLGSDGSVRSRQMFAGKNRGSAEIVFGN